MLDPQGLFELTGDQPSAQDLAGPILIHAMTGFIDAGHAGRLAAAHLREALPNRVLARFDHDQLYDYRARRPVMTFVENRWESYETPALELSLAQDSAGRSFLMLTGPEPDVQWERFVAAVAQLVERFGVATTVGVHAIPMAVPHTRPVGVTAHATRPELVAGFPPWVGRVQVPGNVGALLEYRLGKAGKDAVGYAVHVPHYLAQTEYPDAAKALVEHVATLGGLALPTAELDVSAAQVREAVESQIEDQPEVRAVVAALEEQYDAFVAGRGRSLLADETAALPTADELGAELERFLAEENERRGRGDD